MNFSSVLSSVLLLVSTFGSGLRQSIAEVKRLLLLHIAGECVMPFFGDIHTELPIRLT